MAQAVKKSGGRVGVFPIIEYWRDIGRPEDLEAAHREHAEQFLNLPDGETLIPTETLS